MRAARQPAPFGRWIDASARELLSIAGILFVALDILAFVFLPLYVSIPGLFLLVIVAWVRTYARQEGAERARIEQLQQQITELAERLAWDRSDLMKRIGDMRDLQREGKRISRELSPPRSPTDSTFPHSGVVGEALRPKMVYSWWVNVSNTAGPKYKDLLGSSPATTTGHTIEDSVHEVQHRLEVLTSVIDRMNEDLSWEPPTPPPT